MDAKELLIDGIDQFQEWTLEALKDLSQDQLDWLPEGKTTSAGFNAWHIWRTQDNIVNFVFQREKGPIWMREGYVERMGLPKVAQGTGMALEEARGLRFDKAQLIDYGQKVYPDVIAFIRDVPESVLDEVQMIKPLGEMPKWKVIRQVLMTHGFMHLGEINAIRGQLGLQFSI